MKSAVLLLLPLVALVVGLVLPTQAPSGGSPEVQALYARTEALARSQAALRAYAADEAAKAEMAPAWVQPPLDSYLALPEPAPFLTTGPQ